MPRQRQDRDDPNTPEPLEIGAGDATVIIDPVAGGRVAQITVGGQPLLVAPEPDRAPTIAWGSFPMAPWAGRTRHGRFGFEGSPHQLERNHLDAPRTVTTDETTTDETTTDETTTDETTTDETTTDETTRPPADEPGRPDRPDPRWHAIHGTVFARSWELEWATSTAVSMRCPLGRQGGWPFDGGTASQLIEISEDGLACVLSLEAAGSPFPAVIGWHPWFLGPARLDFRPTAMYERDRFGLPTGAITEPTAGPWDDCFIATGPAIVEYDRDVAPVISVSSDCDHWVIFDEPRNSICVEPQSGPPDGLNIGHELVAPGRPLSRTMSISW